MFNLFKNKQKREEQKKTLEDIFIAGQERRRRVCEAVRPDDADFGYAYTNAIPTSGASSSEGYLKRLRTLDGKSFTWIRESAVDFKGVEGVIDIYQLYLDGEKHCQLYLNMYGHNMNKAPLGMKLLEEV